MLLFSVCKIYPQSINFKNISTKDGLASNECYKIIQDKLGYIWIATDAGLCKYNGKEFKTFTTDDGLPSNTIFEIMEDKYGRILGGCFNGGLFCIKDDSVIINPSNDQLIYKVTQKKELLMKIALDNKDVIHIGTSHSYYQLFPSDGYRQITTSSNNESSFHLIKEVDNDMLFARIIAPTHLDFSKESIYLLECKDTAMKFYLETDNNKLRKPTFFATKKPMEGFLFTFDNSLYSFESEVLTKMDFSKSIVCVYYDRFNNLWVGLYELGFVLFPEGDLNSKGINGLDGLTVSSFCVDREGGIWITTTNRGVFYHPNSKVYVHNELMGINTTALYSSNNGLYVATEFHNIWKYNNGVSNHLIEPKNLFQSKKMHLVPFKEKIFQLGGESFSFTEKGNIEFIKEPKNKSNITLAGITIAKDSIWGVNHQDIVFIERNLMKAKFSLPSRGFCIFYSSRGELLVGCMDGLYEFKNNQFQKVSISFSEKNVRVSYITEDHDGNLLLSTKGNGIFFRSRNNWYNINANHGLKSNICNHIYCSSEGKYFISTNKGITVYDSQSKNSLFYYDVSNGLLANDVNMCTKYNGYVYVATEEGLCYFDDNDYFYNSSLPILSLKRIQLNNQLLLSGKKYSYYMNDLSFSCDVLSYINPNANKIRYQLLPVDKYPKYSDSYEINYDNLPPGEYSLIIQGVNSNGIEGSSKKYDFIITKPFWNTIWFFLLSGFTLFTLIYVLVRQRIIYIRKREEEKNLLKQKIVEFHYTALRAQMNPHFIFNVINSIQLYVLNNQPKEAYNYLSKFSKLIRRVLQNSEESLVRLSHEMETVLLYMELEKIRLEDNIRFLVFIEDKIDQTKIFVPSMIIQPLLENAIWHGIVPLKGSRIGIIRLDITSNHDMLKISIRDNGNGMDVHKEREEKKSFGLNLIKDRLSLISDRCKITLANLLNDNGDIAGFEAILEIPLFIE